MATRKESVLASGILVLLVGGIVVACGSDPAVMPPITDDPPAPSVPTTVADAGPGTDADAGPQVLPPLPPTKQDEVTEQFGVFVSSGGALKGKGTRADPMATITEGIDAAVGSSKKLVFVCAGTYREVITLASGVSIVANMDCSNPATWTLNGAHATLAAPTSPAVVAKNITAATRIGGLDVLAPRGSEGNPSSIALVVVDSNGLTFSNGKLAASSGADGMAGVPFPPFVQTVARPPAAGSAPSGCIGGMSGSPCSDPGNGGAIFLPRPATPVALGGQIDCVLDGTVIMSSTGGAGGVGALYRPDGSVYSVAGAGQPGTPAATPPTQVAGASSDGGTFSETGFAPGNGEDGTQTVAMSAGGAGGPGAFNGPFGGMTYGSSGGGGGGGGCPGRRATGGQGGGASVAVVSLRSIPRFEDMKVEAEDGGKGGPGHFGALPTSGQLGASGASSGAAGIFAGPSGHGAGGPSIAIAHTGGAPILVTTQLTHGAAGTSPVALTEPPNMGQPARTIAAAGKAVAVDVHPF